MAAAAAAATSGMLLRLRLATSSRTLTIPISLFSTRARFFHGAAARPRREDPTAVNLSEDESKDSAERLSTLWGDILENKRYRDKEAVILKDIEPIRALTKKILHSDRYRDGERLTDDHEKAVVENLLVYHPHSEDKIGCGIDCIMVI